MAKGISDTVTNPVGTVVGEVKHALDSPSAAYYAGEKTFELSAAAATAPFGAEGAIVRAGLPAELVTEGGIPLSVMRGWDPLGGMPPTEFDNLFGPAGARVFPDNNGFPLAMSHNPPISLRERSSTESDPRTGGTWRRTARHSAGGQSCPKALAESTTAT